jgi:rhodanese-related sulfurtransferase
VSRPYCNVGAEDHFRVRWYGGGCSVSGKRNDGEVQHRPPGSSTIDQVLEAARARLLRLSPAEAHEAARDGAVLVDIRPVTQRTAEGEIPGALVIDRNVLEWRLDPASDARLPEAVGYDTHIVIVCAEGYASSLAAAALHALGLSRATDVIGGFRAWQAAGLPTRGAT